MGRFDNIKTAIDTNIKTNGNQAITGAVLNSVMQQTVDSVDTQLTELESEINDIESETIGVADVSFQDVSYTKVPAIKSGEKITISLKNISGEVPLVLYGKTESSDSTYQTLGLLTKVGEELNVVADFDINYVRAISTPSGTTSMYPLVLTFSNEKSINIRLEKLKTEIAEIQSDTQELKMGIFGADVIYNNTSYLNVPQIKVGEKVRISLKSISDSSPIYIYGKKSESESTYQRLGFLHEMGEYVDSVAEFDINYIRVVSEPPGNSSIYPLIITLSDENNIASELYQLEKNNVSLKEDIDTLNEDVEDLSYLISGADVSFQDVSYTKVPAIKSGEKITISLKNISGEVPLVLYGKTESSDSTYQTLGLLTKVGEELNVVADFDINYVRAISTPSGTTSMYPLVLTFSNEKSINIRLEKLEKGESAINAVPCMFNPAMDFNRQDLKIFDIGNSYTLDAQNYLPGLIQAAGLPSDYSLYRAHRAGASFKSWSDCYNNADTRDYIISKCSGQEIDGISGSGVAMNGELFRNALTSVKWDVVLIHQVSMYANNFELWQGTGEGGYLRELIQIIRKTNPQATIGFLLVHSYRSSYDGNSEGSSLERWKNIAQSAKDLKANYGIDFIIPYGTAVQNLRASSLNDDYEFSNDGTHLAAGLGDYVAGCCYFQSLFAPRFGVGILGNTYRITGLDESLEGQRNVTDTTALIAQKAAMLATYNMWSIMNPEEYNL